MFNDPTSSQERELHQKEKIFLSKLKKIEDQGRKENQGGGGKPSVEVGYEEKEEDDSVMTHTGNELPNNQPDDYGARYVF